MKKILGIVLAVSCGNFLSANDVATDFNATMKLRKGPFGLNHLVDYVGFQGAFRNEAAKKLVTDHGFYTANLFVTNYHELVARFVYGVEDPEAKGAVKKSDHPALLDRSAEALPFATSILKHWVLERYYIDQNPESLLSKSFQLKGISGFEFEVPYARYFFNFYANALEKVESEIEKDYRYLYLFGLLKSSPLTDSPSLERARTLVDGFSGGGSERNRRLYRLRNSIHNQPSLAVVDDIDRFQADFGDLPSSLAEAKKLLIRYFSVDSSGVAKAAEAAGQNQIRILATYLAAANNSPGDRLNLLLNLSRSGTELKKELFSPSVSSDKKVPTLLLLAKMSQYISKEVGNLSFTFHKSGELQELEGPEFVEIIINAAFLEGLLLSKNHAFFVGKLSASTSLLTAVDLLPSVISIATATLKKAYVQELDQWVSVQATMEKFIDNTLKSSPLAMATDLSIKVKGQ